VAKSARHSPATSGSARQRSAPSRVGGPDDAFGHWFAGFADGEGSFDIHSVASGAAYICRFIIGLRSDDRAVLDEIAARTGLGSIYAVPPRESQWHSARAQVTWTVARKAEVLRLVAIFDRYPLRAKKARDFATWRLAVFAWQEVKARRPGYDWSRMAQLKQELEAGRRYETASVEAGGL
jgi:hypothetical protein